MINLAEAWQRLGSERKPPGHGWVTLRIHPESPCAIRAAIHGPDEALAVMFEVPETAVAPDAEMPSGAGFQVLLEEMEDPAGGLVRLCLVREAHASRELFTSLVEDAIRVVCRQPSPAAVPDALITRINAWQSFLKRRRNRLSDEDEIGLFAELQVLSSLLFPAMKASKALLAWRGPLGAPHDFLVGNAGLEVKSTCTASPVRIRISSLAQLDDGALEHLVLAHVLLGRSANGQTLPELVDMVWGNLPGEDLDAVGLLESRLMDAGYSQIHAPEYRDRFEVRETRFYRVEEGFPRLLSRDVPPGVIEASYLIDTALMAGFRIEAAEVRSMLVTRHQGATA